MHIPSFIYNTHTHFFFWRGNHGNYYTSMYTYVVCIMMLYNSSLGCVASISLVNNNKVTVHGPSRDFYALEKH